MPIQRWAIAVATIMMVAEPLFLSTPTRGEPPPDRLAALARGVSLTGWFRFPGRADPATLRSWLGDAAMADLRHAGFTFVRLAVQPEFVGGDPARQRLLISAIRRLQGHGLAVVIDAHPAAWRLDHRPGARQALLDFWRILAPTLRQLPNGLTFPELLNEPVFQNDAPAWQALQHAALQIVRAALPNETVVLTGNDWGSIAGLLTMYPEPDPNVVYSFHFYDPVELTSLATYRADVLHNDLSRLPFPAVDEAACNRIADASSDPPTVGLMRFYCAFGWSAGRVAASIGAAAAWGRHHRAAVLLGEFGASNRLNPSARLAWLRAVREACESHRIGWTLWGYDDVMGFAVSRPPGRPSLDAAILKALGLRRP